MTNYLLITACIGATGLAVLPWLLAARMWAEARYALKYQR